MDNENVMQGYGIDPTTVYGSSLHQQVANRTDPTTEDHVLDDSPMAGPNAVGDASTSGGLGTIKGFLNSPVGLLVILLPVAYWLFNEVYA
jgi:hypothetical protein